MKLSRTVAYAVRATLQLARQNSGAPVPCSRLAAEGNMPERFLLQILRNLVTHGILRSTRGVDGGYVLVRPPEELSLLEVIEAIEGPLETDESICEGLPPGSRERLVAAMRQVILNSRKQLDSIKFAHLLPDPPASGASGLSRPSDRFRGRSSTESSYRRDTT
jgi:Rrf2 family protein